MSELSEQVSKQYRAVAHLAEALAQVHSQMVEIVKRDDDAILLSLRGNRSANIMELLGNILNGMDAVDRDADAWLDRVFEDAHRLFPQRAGAEKDGGR